VPWASEDHEQAEDGNHHLDDLLVTFRRRHVAHCHLRAPRDNHAPHY